jgi:sugar phosphate isomerase/epimerase
MQAPTGRRQFLQQLGVIGLFSAGLNAAAGAEPKTTKEPGARQSQMKLGMVTYQLGQDWDLPTIIKNCRAGGFDGVELRTSHKHGVEVSLTAAERNEVRQKFQDSGVELMGLGSAFDYHTPDQAKLKADINATREYIKLAHDVGAPGVKVRPNGFPKDISKEKTLEQIGRSLRELGDFGEGYGVQIRLEVHGTGTSLLPNIKTIMDVANHRMVGVCWNSNQSDLEGQGFDANFAMVKDKIFTVHMRDLYLEEYPFRRMLQSLTQNGFKGYCLAEIPPSTDPVRVMKYLRALWLSYQDLL